MDVIKWLYGRILFQDGNISCALQNVTRNVKCAIFYYQRGLNEIKTCTLISFMLADVEGVLVATRRR